MSEIRIVLPLPSKYLSPNSRCHWAVKSKAVKQYRGDACYAAWMATAADKVDRKWPAAEAEAHFYFKDKRRRDGDNLLSSLKPVWDGLQDAGVVADDAGITHKPVKRGVDKNDPRVEIVIRPLAS